MQKVAVYTAITGGYDKLPHVEHVDDRLDYVCFTDSNIPSDGVWEIRRLYPVLADPQREARRVKLLPHFFLPQYDLSLWIDANTQLLNCTLEFIEQHTRQQRIACSHHTVRDCLYDEADVVLSYDIDDPGAIRTQMYKYKSLGFPRHYGLHGTTLLLRRHNEARCKIFSHLWWQECANYSKRDQLSFDFARWVTQEEFLELPYETLYKPPFAVWGKDGNGGHQQQDRRTVRKYWAFPSLTADGQGKYKESYFAQDFLLRAFALQNTMEELEEESRLPLPTNNSAQRRAALLRLLAAAEDVLIWGYLSPLWILWANEAKGTANFSWVYDKMHPLCRVHENVLKSLLPGRLHTYSFSPEALIKAGEQGDIFKWFDTVIITDDIQDFSSILLQLYDKFRDDVTIIIFSDNDQCRVVPEDFLSHYMVVKEKNVGPLTAYCKKLSPEPGSEG